MCSLDFSDGYVRLLSASSPVARKCHRCRECRRDIAAGERIPAINLRFAREALRAHLATEEPA